MIKYVVNANEAGQTLEKYIKRKLEVAPLSFIYKLFRKKDIKVNGKREGNKFIVSAGDNIDVYITDKQYEDFKKCSPIAKDNEVKNWIIYEDDNILVLNKPKGLLVQRNKANGTALDQMVLNYYLFKHPETKEGDFLPCPAHRLDRNTSGLIIFGKSVLAMQELTDIFKSHEEIEKTYLALCVGDIKKDGMVDVPLYKDDDKGFVSVSFNNPKRKNALTYYKVVKNYGMLTLCDVKIITGRTHQIRVHMAHIGHPLAGDGKYGDYDTNHEIEKRYGIDEQFLHAKEIKFKITKGKLKYLNDIKFVAPLSKKDLKILENIERE